MSSWNEMVKAPILFLTTCLADPIPDFVVCVTSLPGEELKELAALGAVPFPVDVTSTDSVKALKDAVVDDLGDELDVLINCA